MKLSVIIPAHNESESITETISTLYKTLQQESIDHEIIVVNDHSTDSTESVLQSLKETIKTLQIINNHHPNGFGFAVRCGLEHFNGDCVAIMMADLSDNPTDLVTFYNTMKKGHYDCVFGDRWSKYSKVYDYPIVKKFLNRMFNYGVALSFGLRYRDMTNAFKLYNTKTINGLKPFLSPHFNLTLELPLKAIIRGYSYRIVPNSWTNRKHGVSKLKLKEMGSRYFFVYLYCLIEKFFSRGDYKK